MMQNTFMLLKLIQITDKVLVNQKLHYS